MRSDRIFSNSLFPVAGLIILGAALAIAQNPNDNRKTNDKDTGRKQTQQKTATRDDGSRRDGAQARNNNRRSLGMQVEANGNQGLSVGSVEEGSAAARAGLRQNDRIVSVGGRTINNQVQFQAFLASQWGRPVPIVIERDGKQMTVQYALPPGQEDQAWLGVFLEEGDANRDGAHISQVYPAGPAARAGLQAGDVIQQIDGQKIAGPGELIGLVQDMQPNAQVQVVIARNDQQQTIPVTLGSRQQEFAQYQGGGYPQYGQQQFNGQFQNGQSGQAHDHYYQNVPPYAMSLEHDRRIAEQHERIENEIRQLRDEIKQLREELKKR